MTGKKPAPWTTTTDCELRATKFLSGRIRRGLKSVDPLIPAGVPPVYLFVPQCTQRSSPHLVTRAIEPSTHAQLVKEKYMRRVLTTLSISQQQQQQQRQMRGVYVSAKQIRVVCILFFQIYVPRISFSWLRNKRD